MDTLDANPADYSRTVLPARRAQIPAECAGLRLDAALARVFPDLSRSRLQQWIKDGRITIDGAPVDAKRKAWGGESVEVA